MSRKNDTPQKATMREFMKGYLKQNDVKIKDAIDVKALMRDMEIAIPRDRNGTSFWKLS